MVRHQLHCRRALVGTTPGAMGATSALACGVGAVFLVASGVASWRILAGGIG